MYLVTILRNVPFQALHAVWVVNQLFHSFRQFHFAKKGSLVYFPDQLNYLSSFFSMRLNSAKSLYMPYPAWLFFSRIRVWGEEGPHLHTHQHESWNSWVSCHMEMTSHNKKKSKIFLNLSFLHRYFLGEVAKSGHSLNLAVSIL